MKQLLQKLLLPLRVLMSKLPSKLPVGMAEFHEWSDSIIDLSGKFADEVSMKFALSSMIVHLKPDQGYVSKDFFVKSLRKAAANQVASQFFQDIKQRQEDQKASSQVIDVQPQAEVTAAPQESAAPSNGQTA